MCGAILWNYLNGFLQASGISTSTPSMLRGTIGILLFVVGGYGNYWHDQVLAELRRSSTEKYGIPRGGLYKYISFPNYFCEWIEWTGYAICQNQAPGESQAGYANDRVLVRVLGNHGHGSSGIDWASMVQGQVWICISAAEKGRDSVHTMMIERGITRVRNEKVHMHYDIIFSCSSTSLYSVRPFSR